MANLNLEDVCMFFRIQSTVDPKIRKNFSDMYRRKGQSLTCPSCTGLNRSVTSRSVTDEQGEMSPNSLHSQSHILNSCEAVNDLRIECDPEDDKSLTDFFRKVVARNMKIEKNKS